MSDWRFPGADACVARRLCGGGQSAADRWRGPRRPAWALTPAGGGLLAGSPSSSSTAARASAALTRPEGPAGSQWQNPVGLLALCAGGSASGAPTGSMAKRRRLVNLDLPALKLAATSEVKGEPPRETHYSQNGQSMERIQEVMRGRCGCKRDCFTKVSASAVKAVCDMFWALPPEEQSFLAGDSVAPQHGQQHVANQPRRTCHTLEQQLLNRL